MSRRIGSIALVVVAVLAAWFFWRPVNSASARPGITLLVNLQARLEVTPGTPLSFDVSLGDSRSGSVLDVGSRWWPWHTLVHLEDADGDALHWAAALLGEPRSIQLTSDSEGRPQLKEASSAVARLEAGRHVHTMTLVAGPEVTAHIAPGTYRVRAALETPFWLRWGWTGRVVSAAATVVVVDPAGADEGSQQLEAQRIAAVTEFHMSAERFDDAYETATQLTTLQPDEPRSYVLLGDAAVGMNRPEEALSAYHRAVALTPPLYEEPVLLMQRISRVNEELSQSEADQ